MAFMMNEVLPNTIGWVKWSAAWLPHLKATPKKPPLEMAQRRAGSLKQELVVVRFADSSGQSGFLVHRIVYRFVFHHEIDRTLPGMNACVLCVVCCVLCDGCAVSMSCDA